MNLTQEIKERAAQLGEYLLRAKWQISCAESCTGGGIGYAITSVSGSSQWFEKGFITYSNSAKESLLGVATSDLIESGAVSQPVVEQMACGAAKNAKAQVAVSVSGVAGPDGGSAEKPVGTVWFGFYIDGKVVSEKCCFSGDRDAVREQTILHALIRLIGMM